MLGLVITILARVFHPRQSPLNGKIINKCLFFVLMRKPKRLGASLCSCRSIGMTMGFYFCFSERISFFLYPNLCTFTDKWFSFQKRCFKYFYRILSVLFINSSSFLIPLIAKKLNTKESKGNIIPMP